MGSHAFFTVRNINQSDATLAGKDPAGVKFPAPQVTEMTNNRIGKEFAEYSRCRASYRKIAGLIYAFGFIHVPDI